MFIKSNKQNIEEPTDMSETLNNYIYNNFNNNTKID